MRVPSLTGTVSTVRSLPRCDAEALLAFEDSSEPAAIVTAGAVNAATVAPAPTASRCRRFNERDPLRLVIFFSSLSAVRNPKHVVRRDGTGDNFGSLSATHGVS